MTPSFLTYTLSFGNFGRVKGLKVTVVSSSKWIFCCTMKLKRRYLSNIDKIVELSIVDRSLKFFQIQRDQFFFLSIFLIKAS